MSIFLPGKSYGKIYLQTDQGGMGRCRDLQNRRLEIPL